MAACLPSAEGTVGVFVWDVGRGRLASVLQGHTNVVVSTHFPRLVICWRRCLGRQRHGSGTPRRVSPLITMPVLALLGFSPDDRRLAFLDGLTLGLWDLSQGQEVRTLQPLPYRQPDGNQGLRRGARGPVQPRQPAGGAGRHAMACTSTMRLSGRELARLKVGICETLLFRLGWPELDHLERRGSVPLADPSRP